MQPLKPCTNLLGTRLLTTGDNGRIKYSIEAGDDSNDFEILQNGTILTKNLLDRESKSGYNLIVLATDCTPGPEKRLSSTVQVSAAPHSGPGLDWMMVVITLDWIVII